MHSVKRRASAARCLSEMPGGKRVAFRYSDLHCLHQESRPLVLRRLTGNSAAVPGFSCPHLVQVSNSMRGEPFSVCCQGLSQLLATSSSDPRSGHRTSLASALLQAVEPSGWHHARGCRRRGPWHSSRRQGLGPHCESRHQSEADEWNLQYSSLTTSPAGKPNYHRSDTPL